MSEQRNQEEREVTLCQYCATGAFFYAAYENGAEMLRVFSVVRSRISDVQICREERKFHSEFDMDSTLMPGLKRSILDEEGELAAVLTWHGAGRYVMAAKSSEICIALDEDGYCGSMDSQPLFSSVKCKELDGIGDAFERDGYDMACTYRISFNCPVSEEVKMLICAFPMLQIAPYHRCWKRWGKPGL